VINAFGGLGFALIALGLLLTIPGVALGLGFGIGFQLARPLLWGAVAVVVLTALAMVRP
jgi:hypothetical protein